VTRLRIYTNESVPVAVAEGLQRREVDAWSARDSARLGTSDEEQLTYAYQEHAVVFTHDHDFLRIANRWTATGREHWGVIYAPQGKIGIGETVRRLIEYATIFSAEEMMNRIEFL
jgi:hypothetical protein